MTSSVLVLVLILFAMLLVLLAAFGAVAYVASRRGRDGKKEED